MSFPPFAVLVPLLAGFLLLAIAGVAIYKKPNIAGSHIALLLAGALLCIAPTLTQFSLKAMGFELTAGLKETVVEQGTDFKRKLADLEQKVEALGKKAGVSATPTPAETLNRNEVILIAYDSSRRQIARDMEKFLLDKGYSANAINSNLKEVETKLSAGQTSLVYVKGQVEIAQKIQQEVIAKFPSLGTVKMLEAPSLDSGNVQFRLF